MAFPQLTDEILSAIDDLTSEGEAQVDCDVRSQGEAVQVDGDRATV